MLVDINYCSSPSCWGAEPRSERIRKAMVKDAIKNGAPKKFDGSIFMQSLEDLENAFSDEIPERQMKAIQDGYNVTVRMDEWSFRHMLGYCAD